VFAVRRRSDDRLRPLLGHSVRQAADRTAAIYGCIYAHFRNYVASYDCRHWLRNENEGRDARLHFASDPAFADHCAPLNLYLDLLTHPFNGPLSGTTQVSRYQKGETNLDFTEARFSEWQ